MSFQMALAQFEDNLARIGGEAAALAEPEKYNLYSGLVNSARGLVELQAEVEELRRER